MEIRKTKISHEDERGQIRDIMVHTPVDAITYITFKKDVVRGNHYHEKTMQYDYIISGSLVCRTKKDIASPVEEVIVVAGDFIEHPYLVRHAYKALEDSVMISSTNGPRQGDEYENDTFRLNEGEKLF
jgi:quercetin dioxygenase-like cupin family protein